MKYCTKCGNKLLETEKFCTKCGSKTVSTVEQVQQIKVNSNWFNENKKIVLIASGGILVILVALGITYAMSTGFGQSNEELTTSIEHSSENSVFKDVETGITHSSEIGNSGNIFEDNIRRLIESEDNRDLNGILSYLSPNIERYWSIEYPSSEQLSKTYYATWNKLTRSSNVIDAINKIDDYTYDMHNTFTFTSKRTRETKTINSIVRFKFDQEGKIIYVNGMKQ